MKLKCKACGFVWDQRRLPRRCANCRAYLAVVGCEILSRTTGKAAPKKLPEAKEPKIGPETAEPEPKPEVAHVQPPIKQPSKPKTPAPIPKTLELDTPKPPLKARARAPEETYDCGNCGAKITKGMEKCPECGVELNWEDISE